MNLVLRRLGALGIMVLGVGLVLGIMTMMNRYTQPPKKEKKRVTASIEIKKVKPKPKKRKAQQKRKAQKRKAVRRSTPPPNLGSGLSGLSLGLQTQFGNAHVGGGDALLGKTNGKNLLMTSDTVDVPPKATRRISPKYPNQARKKGITGYVSFSLVIGPEGEIVRSKIIDAKPAGVFESAARDAVERWTFSPGKYKGNAQTVVVEQTIRFTLTRGA